MGWAGRTQLRTWRRAVVRMVGLGSAAALALACGDTAAPPAAPAPAGTPPAAAAAGAAGAAGGEWPSGAFAFGEVPALRALVGRVAGLGDTPLRRTLDAALSRVERCGRFVGRGPGGAQELANALRCAQPADQRWFEAARARDAALVLVAPLPGVAAGRLELLAYGDPAATLRLELGWLGSLRTGPAALWLPDARPPGPPRLSSRAALAQARIRPAGGIDIAALVEDGGQADRLFRLKSRLLSGAVLAGVWELVLYAPAAGTDVPLPALGLDLASQAAAGLAVDRFVADLEATWPIRHAPRSFGEAAGACFDELRLLPEFAPCYALRDDLLVVGWNDAAVAAALAGPGPAPILDAAGGAALWLDRIARADEAMAEAAEQPPAELHYGWQRAHLRPLPSAPEQPRFRVDLRSGEDT